MSYPGDPRIESDVQAHGWAGTAGSFHTSDNIAEAGAEYGRLVEEARRVRLEQQEFSVVAPDSGRGRDRGPNPTTEY